MKLVFPYVEHTFVRAQYTAQKKGITYWFDLYPCVSMESDMMFDAGKLSPIAQEVLRKTVVRERLRLDGDGGGSIDVGPVCECGVRCWCLSLQRPRMQKDQQ